MTNQPPENEPSQGWRIRSGRTVFETPWMRVRSYDVTAPTGFESSYGLVSFRNIAVGMLPLEADGTTWLVGQHRFSVGQYGWEVPEGGCPINTDPFDTAVRELSEETGLKAGEWHPLLANLHLSNSVTDERAFAWLAWDLSPCDAYKPDETEVLKLRRLPVGEAVHMAVNGEITDAFSLAILLKADHLWRTGQLPAPAAAAFAAGQV